MVGLEVGMLNGGLIPVPVGKDVKPLEAPVPLGNIVKLLGAAMPDEKLPEGVCVGVARVAEMVVVEAITPWQEHALE